MPEDLNPRAVVEWFGDRAPVSSIGMIRLGEALIATGERDKGVELIRKAWTQGSFTQSDEAEILRAHSDILSQANHRARLDQLLARDDMVAAKRQIARVDNDYARIANARIRLKASPAAVKIVLDSLPAELQANSGLLYDAARAFRQRGMNEDAATTHRPRETSPERRSNGGVSATSWHARRSRPGATISPTISLPNTRRIPAPACMRRSFSPVGSRFASCTSPKSRWNTSRHLPKA
jgi:hypothetical protein